MDYQMVRVVNALCDDLGTPRAALVKELVKEEKWLELQQLKARPQDYSDADSYWKDAVITDLLRKCDLPSSVDKEAVAVATFKSCEAQNATTNARLSRFIPESLLIETPEDERVLDFINLMRKDISFVTGNLPDHLTPRFSGGATYADTGVLITTPDKMSSTPTIYSDTEDLLPFWHETLWATSLVKDRPWQSRPRRVRGNIFFCVPKDGKTFRGCCKEASVNIGFQLDVGRLLKNRLQRIGIDLRKGQQIHRQLAREASVTEAFATIDMSNASDTLSRVVPKLLLREDWFGLLNSLRATHTRIEGSWFRLEKFSSMGNGFTFELETLIFACLARTVVTLEGGDPLKVKCYGDDLIVPSIHYRGVVAALRFFGFTPNMNKTFAEGPFRESCGGDFWSGVPVRAHFIEKLPNEPHQWISLANGLRRLAIDHSDDDPRWSVVRRAWLRALDPIPSHIRRCRVPETLGDVVIHDKAEFWGITVPPRNRTNRDHRDDEPYSMDPRFPRLHEVKHHETWDNVYVRAWQPVPSVLPWHHWLPSVVLASATLGLPSRGITPRGGVDGYRMGVAIANTGPASSWLPQVTFE